jgi:DNA-binding transcriptional MerR regulator
MSDREPYIIEKIKPDVTNWHFANEPVLKASRWYETESFELDVVNDDVDNLNWYIAQGWVATKDGAPVVTVDEDTKVTITTQRYWMRRRGINPEKTLDSLIRSYTKAYNEGRMVNDQRYDDIVTIYTGMLDKTEDDLNDLAQDYRDYDNLVAIILADLEVDFNTYQDVINGLLTVLSESHDNYQSLTDAFNTVIESDNASYTEAIENLLAIVRADHSEHETEILAKHAELLSDNDDYAALVNSVVSLVASDYTTHARIVESLISSIQHDFNSFSGDMDGLLDDYGNSITARINTKFDNQLTSLRQGLVDRGMYNSTIWDSLIVGIERERELALTDLVDKITQQQVGLKQNVYREQTAMSERVMASRDHLYAELIAIRNHKDAAGDKLFSAKRDMRMQIISSLESLQTQLQKVNANDITTKSQINETLTRMRTLSKEAQDRLQSHIDTIHSQNFDAQNRLNDARTNMRNKIFDARDRLAGHLANHNQKHLELRNRIVENMVGFLERREDDYPDLGSVGKLAESLGTKIPTVAGGH